MVGTAKTRAAVLLDTVARLGDDGGCVDSAACSTAVLGQRRNRAREEEEEALEGGNGSGRERGISRREKGARGGLEGARRRRVVPGWLGGIPPSSLEARGGEEDPAAPVGRLG